MFYKQEKFLKWCEGRFWKPHRNFLVDELKRGNVSFEFVPDPEFQEILSELIFTPPFEEEKEDFSEEPMNEDDELYEAALKIAYQYGKISVSMLQRKLRIGYNRAARLVERMEEEGIVGPSDGVRPRPVINIPKSI